MGVLSQVRTRASRRRVWSVVTVVLLLSLALSGAALAAEKTVLQFWTGWEGIRTEAWMMLAEEFNATHDDIQIEALQRVADANNLFPTLAAGVAPDFVLSSSVWTLDHARNNVLANLRPYLDRDGIVLEEEILPGLMAPNTLNGDPHAIPVNGELYWAYTNPVVLAEAGLSLPQAGWTWADFRSYSQAITRVDANGNFERAGIVPASPYGTALTLIAQAGGRVMNEASTGPAVNSPEVRQALEFAAELIDSNLMAPSSVGRAGFIEGKVGFFIDGSQRLSLFEQEMEAGTYEVTPMPIGPAGEPRTWGSALTLAMVKTGDEKRMAATWEALKWLTSTEAIATYNAYVKAIPPRIESIRHPNYTSVYESSPGLRQWVEHVFNYATGDGFIGLPAQAVTAEVRAFATFFGPDRPPLNNFLIDLEHELQVIFDENLKNAN